MASIRKEGKYYKLYFYEHGKLRKISLRTASKKIAEQIKRKVEDELAAGKFKLESYTRAILLENFLQEAEEFSQNNKSFRTWKREQLIFQNFLTFCGNISLSKINVKLIELYKIYLLEEREFRPTSVNIELRHLSAALTLAVKYGYLSKNPFKEVSKLKVPKKTPIFLTPEQANRLLEFTRDRNVYQYIFIALNTGARISEVCSLLWKNVDLENRTLKLVGKGSKERTVPITEALYQFLSKKKDRSDYVVTGSKDIHKITRQFRKYSDRIGLHNFTFHNLRDTYASWLVQQGVSLKIIQELLGHESIKTTLIYAHLAPDSRFAAVKVIDQQLRSAQEKDNLNT